MEALIADALPVLGVLGIAPGASRSSGAAISHDELSVSIVDSIAGLEALESEWLALERAPRSRTTPFQSYRFHREWVRHFAGANVSFRILTVRSGAALLLILPLAIRRTPFGAVASWMGDPLIQYGDAICAPDTDASRCLDAAYAALKQNRTAGTLSLRRVRADAAVAEWCKAHMHAVGAQDEAISVDLSDFAEHGDFARARTRRATRNRKCRRKLAQSGDVTFRFMDGGDEAARLVDRTIELKKAWLAQRGLLGRAFADERMTACLKALARGPAESGNGAVISCLEIAGKPVSIEYAFRHNGLHCAFVGAFEADLSMFSPGHVQMQDTIERCIADGMKAYDLMAPADRYKRELGTTAVAVQDYATSLSIAGIPATLVTSYGRRGAKAAFGLMPRSVRASIKARLT